MATSGDGCYIYDEPSVTNAEWVATSNLTAGSYVDLEYTAPVDWRIDIGRAKPVNEWEGQRRKKYD